MATTTNQPVNYQLTRTVNAIPDVFSGATFEEIKSDLLDWISSQDEFKDYDFVGSRLNILLDLLAYNTLYIQQFSNTAVYESFIRTANLRSSVVQAAQDAGYFPASRSAAESAILLTCTHSLNPTSIRIPRGTKFLAYARDASADPYSFVVLEDVIAVRDINSQYLPIVKLAQGRFIRTQLTYDPATPILIRDEDIDRNQVRVFVDGAEWTNWTRKSMVHAGSASTIYYMRETIDGHTEFYFGEGTQNTDVTSGVLNVNYVGGLKPLQGATVVIEYLRTDGEEANGATDFSYADSLQYISVVKVTENYDSSADYVGADGGGDPENIERIRELAVVKREAQMRAVTATDYETFVSERFGSIVQAVQCFTDNNKPGYAFIAIKPKSGLLLTQVQREDVQDYLADYNLAPITPAVISPNYLFLKHDIKVTYSVNKLQESEQWLQNQIITKIDDYYTADVEVFNASFAKSKMLTYIDEADHSIIGSNATISMVREVDNFYSTPESGIKYYNTVSSQSVVSDVFSFIATSELSYDIRIAATAADASGDGKIVVGPFRDGDITENENIKPYTGTDFNKLTVTDGRDKYYVIGEINYFSDYIYWNFGAIDVESDKFEVQSIELFAGPTSDVIFSSDGSLIVFENDLRPQYTTITMEPITQ
ncbi:baseplate wedge subunit [Erwinia phage Cronus]|uniref:Baseplate wedge protein gp6 n=1 Tax=Erwinia phage Cronus TaxID=2163633 RepID=A0A2S1GLP6_9CAUD|nr:baseplate wedge subunit [Erwinia phage Cronus]AWD90302.1 baseplate wedge subunit [Erwinia phage Cronus]